MDWNVFSDASARVFKNLKKWIWVGVCATAAVILFKTAPQWYQQHQKKAAERSFARESKSLLSVKEFYEIYSHAFSSAQSKVDILREAVEEREKLLLENLKLRQKLETLQFGCKSEVASQVTQQMKRKLVTQTGSRVGRTLASIQYRPPTHLTPEQSYALGVGYFKAREDEKAAVIFTELVNLEETHLFKNTKNYLITGILWYRLENFDLADNYFEKVLNFETTAENLRYQAQARLWKALSAARIGKNSKAQYWLKNLLDYHPHSMEARWVNPLYQRNVRRGVAHEN